MSKMRQIDRVRRIMETTGCAWWTLRQIAQQCLWQFCKKDSEAAISARLRDLRKEGFTVKCQLVAKGRFQREYKLTRGQP